jgi:hypothetical protein
MMEIGKGGGDEDEDGDRDGVIRYPRACEAGD